VNGIAQTLTRPAHDGRLTVEITLEDGAVHIFEIDAKAYDHELAKLMRAPDARRITAIPTHPLSSSYDPREEVGNPS
jgi:hypothetical protein